MKLLIISLLALFSVSTCQSIDSLKGDFDSWIKHYEFQGEFDDPYYYLERLGVFTSNYKQINNHNSKGFQYELAMNEYGHLTDQEFKELNGFKINSIPSGIKRIPFTSNITANTSVDWVTEGAVTPVKNQGSCGSCWSFSTTGSLEGVYFLKTGKLVSFSEQQLVSCDDTDSGCGGGLMDNAFKWINSNGGLCSEDDYPYSSSGGSASVCVSKCKVVSDSSPKTYVDVSPSPQAESAKQADLEKAVTQQPVSIAIEADQLAFRFYSKGVITGTCGTGLDHGVLLVGYGTDNGVDYWKIKNSWGKSWGEDGYVRIQRGKNQPGGQCGLLLDPSYPVL